MYAPDIDIERFDLRHETIDHVDKNHKWIVAGDFNMVKNCMIEEQFPVEFFEAKKREPRIDYPTD